MKHAVFAFAVIGILGSSAYATFPIPSHANGVWVYDSTYHEDNSNAPPFAGLFVKEINAYNAQAQTPHKINEIFSYGGDMEMYCDNNQQCNLKSLNVYYYPQPSNNSKTPLQEGDSGFRSTLAYAAGLDKQKAGGKLMLSPVIDGRIDTGYLKGFNDLSQTEAWAYADKVAMAVCADDRVDGIQFDIEPFDIHAKGQQYFYSEIGKDFAGYYQNNPKKDALHCVDKAHPNGRFFSVFTFANQVNQTFATVFNQYHDGYVIDSLYDLSDQPGGTINPPPVYEKNVDKEVKQMKANADKYGVKYQFAIPASASAHEFQEKNGIPTGYSQLTYVTDALNAIAANQVQDDANFIGVNVWTWDQKMLWNGLVFSPSVPPLEVQKYLGQYL